MKLIGQNMTKKMGNEKVPKAKGCKRIPGLVPDGRPGTTLVRIVVQLVGVWRISGDVVLAMPYIKSCQFKDLIAEIGIDEVKDYTSNLLSALGHIHKFGIIHRDIKPSNFLYDRQAKKFSLIDFGLAQLTGEHRGEKRKLNFGELTSSTTMELEHLEDICDCRGEMAVCEICLSLPSMHAARAGTAGFRPPGSFVEKSHSEYSSGRVGSRSHSSLNVDKVRVKINPSYVYEQLFKPGHILFSNLMMI